MSEHSEREGDFLEGFEGRLLGSPEPRLHEIEVTAAPSSSSRVFSREVDSHGFLEEDSAGIATIQVSQICVSPFQPRKDFDAEELAELANSIEQRGILQPIIVRPLGDAIDEKAFELVAGERRLRAAIQLGLETIPAVISELSDQDALEISIIENAQRADLNPIEEAHALKRLHEEFKLSQADVARAVGKSRSAVTNAIRLLQLPEEVVELLRTGALSAGHGRALLKLEDTRVQVRLAMRAVEQGISVRAVEQLVERACRPSEFSEEDEELERTRSSLKRAEEKIGSALGVERVRVRQTAEGVRSVSISFPSEASWRRFMGRIRD